MNAKSTDVITISVVDGTALELRVGFDVGLYSRVDVEAWVERRILEEESPAEELLELATLSPRSDSEIALLLDGLVPQKSDTFALYVRSVARMFHAKRLSPRAALELLCGQASYPGSVAEEEVLRLEVNMDLVAQGILDVSDAEEEIADFLTRSVNERSDA
ncbi:MAG: hypothetical protein AB8H86_12445 [Polyangiales bacterium]